MCYFILSCSLAIKLINSEFPVWVSDFGSKIIKKLHEDSTLQLPLNFPIRPAARSFEKFQDNAARILQWYAFAASAQSQLRTKLFAAHRTICRVMHTKNRHYE
jgi:hypothetical protein